MPQLSRSWKLKVSQADGGGGGRDGEGLAETGDVEETQRKVQLRSGKFWQLGVVGGKLGWAEGGRGEPRLVR